MLLDRGGAKSYYYSDGLGSIREMADSGGTAQNSYAYGAWGEMRAQSVTIPNIYGYTGREFAEEGLYYYRARYMDPRVGRFVSSDPAGLSAGILIFTYVHNNPANFIDPWGLVRVNLNVHVEFLLKNDPRLWRGAGKTVPNVTCNHSCLCMNNQYALSISIDMNAIIYIIRPEDPIWNTIYYRILFKYGAFSVFLHELTHLLFLKLGIDHLEKSLEKYERNYGSLEECENAAKTACDEAQAVLNRYWVLSWWALDFLPLGRF